MKPTTEQERQALLSHGNELKVRIEQYGYGREFESKTLQLVEIALASLTAEKIPSNAKHYTGCKYPVVKANGIEFMVAGDREDAEEVSEYIGGLYTVPPVPVIKFPGDKDKPQGELSLDFNAGWYAHGVSTKNLNGIK